MNDTTSASSRRLSLAARIAIVLVVGFLVTLALLHILEPEFDPSWRMISEYEIGQYGWLMRIAFACWGLGNTALLVAIWHDLETRGGKVGRWWWALLVIAWFGAGIFVTDPITNQTTSFANIMHNISGVLVILTFPIAATLLRSSLAKNQHWRSSMRAINWLTALAWLAMIAFFATIIISGARNPGLPQFGPHIPQGWPNRLMVLIYALWTIAVAWQAQRINASKR